MFLDALFHRKCIEILIHPPDVIEWDLWNSVP